MLNISVSHETKISNKLVQKYRFRMFKSVVLEPRNNVSRNEGVDVMKIGINSGNYSLFS